MQLYILILMHIIPFFKQVMRFELLHSGVTLVTSATSMLNLFYENN